MGFPTQVRLLNLLGLLSAGFLLANPGIVNAQAGKQNANLTADSMTQPAAEMPAMPEAKVDEVVPTAEPEAETPDKPVLKTIADIASSNDDFKTLTAALKAADLATALASEGPFTVFAPTEKAFAALPDGAVQELLKPENKAILVKILTYHVVPGKLTAADLKSGQVKSLEGSPIAVKVTTSDQDAETPAESDAVEDTEEKAEDKPAATADVSPSVVPVIPKAADLKLPTLPTDKVPTLPTDKVVPEQAKALLPEKAEKAPATIVMVNQAKVEIADVQASNGVIHGIDQVILPPEIMERLQQAPAADAPAAKNPAAETPAAETPAEAPPAAETPAVEPPVPMPKPALPGLPDKPDAPIQLPTQPQE